MQGKDNKNQTQLARSLLIIRIKETLGKDEHERSCDYILFLKNHSIEIEKGLII
jgi:hypothetical protein